MSEGTALSVFISYAHEDEALRRQLEKHLALLRRQGQIRLWHDRRIRPGEAWADRISDHLETADVVLLLVSSDFLASDYCFELEMDRALERHAAGEARVVPVVLRDCDWQSAPFGQLQALPGDGRPVVDDPDGTLTEVARGLRQVVEELVAQRPRPADPEPNFPDDDDRIRQLSGQLDAAWQRLEAATGTAESGTDEKVAWKEIRELQRRIREEGLQPGDFLDRRRFCLIDKVGDGGFSTVWKAFDRRRREMVAVKVLHAQYAYHVDRRRRFFRGAREMAKMEHPSVVRVLEEQGRDGQLHYFVMELVDGEDLSRLVKSDRLVGWSESERLRWILEVGGALAAAHRQGVWHRDVKPGNVLIDAAGRARLTDFDLVRAQDASDATRTGLLGTVVYAAPEAMVSARDAGPAADVYGLAMTAVFTLHGADLPLTALRDGPGFVAGLEASPAVREVLARAVAWEPEARTATIEAFCEQLEACLAPAPPKPTIAPRVEVPDVFRWVETPHDGRVALWREIPAGEFSMGSPEGEGHSDERPRHRVRILHPFVMSAVPVTNAQFAAFDPRHEPRAWKGVPKEELPHHPVVDVTWFRAVEFCRWLAETFPGARLPTEEEWEYACRAGTKTRYWSGNGKKDLRQVGWFGEGSGGRTRRVGEKPPNPWGLYDVHGNVWEWTQSAKTLNYASYRPGRELEPRAVEPADPAAPPSVFVVTRGGGYWNVPDYARSAYRYFRAPVSATRVQGFRVVLPLGLPPELVEAGD